MDESPYVRSRKPVMMSAGPLPAIREGRPQSHLFGEEARQVSSELGRFCEEVFKSTVSLYDPTSEGQPFNGVASQSASRPTQRDLPFPATVWSRGSHQENSLFSWQERPLPAPPVQGRDSFTEELRATRDRLQQRSAQGAAGASQGYLDEVIAHLDKLMQPSTASQGPYHDDRRRVASATADCKSPAMTNRLPAIREEYRISGGESYGGDPVTRDQGYRTASAPISYWLGQTTRENRVDTNETIRLVEQDEMVPSAAVPPLNVKKKSERSSYGESDKRSVSNTPGAEISSIRQSDTEYRDLYHAAFQNDITQESSYTKREPKSRLGWFKRGGASRKEDHKAEVNDREALATPDETAWFTNTNKRRHTRERPDLQAEEEESRRLKLSGTGMKKGGFFNIFSRRDPAKRVVVGGTAELRVGTPDIDDAMSISTSVTSTHRLSSRRRHRRKGSGNLPQRNWLARILHIKPASQIFCFTTSKVRARREVASVLRDWRRYGLKDIMVNKQRNMISGRVDVQNFLHIKPVTFTCTFHTVLEKGRPRTASPLSIARFRQEKGAASSFLKVVQTLENYLTRRDVLVVDRNKCRAMEKVYGDYLKG
ncbi:MAG: hypothetical protein M1816_006508 [Peltula sp. TS41687]|nr:MAG: hypothetical protein M1816_006508 [Peltula sp. TS41687]